MMFKQIQWAAVVLGIASIGAALLYTLIKTEVQAGSATELILAICIVGILFVLSPSADRLGSISLGRGGFRAELEVLQKKTSENDQAITDLILGSMGKHAYKNLKKLDTGDFGQYELEPHKGLHTELYHLRNIGYVKLRKGKAPSIYEIPPYGDQLSDYIKVTPEGHEYIPLREKHEPKG